MTHHPYKFMSRSTHALKLPNHRLTNAAKHLHHCMLVNQLQCMIPQKDLGSCYCDMGPTMEQLSSTHQQWFHICSMWRHLCECSVKVVNTVLSGTTATLQAPTRHHFSVAQPALPPPAQHMQPTSIAPATLATQMNQAPAIPAKTAVQRNAPGPMPVTSHATPMQPQRSSCACMAPRHLIQEI